MEKQAKDFGILAQIRALKEARNSGKKNPAFMKAVDEIKRQWQEKGLTAYGQVQTRGIIGKNGLLNQSAQSAAQFNIYGVQHQQRSWPLIEDLGVKVITDAQANVKYPLIDGNNSQWVEEGESIECTTQFLGLNLRPRRMVSLVGYSSELILLSDSDLEKEIESDLIESVFARVQDTIFNDIFDAENATTLTTFDDLVGFELEAGQKKIHNGVYLVSPQAAANLKKMMHGNFPVMLNNMINGHRVVETPSLEGDKIIFGDFSKLLLVQFGKGLDITLNEITKAPNVELSINSYWAWGMMDENGFIFGKTQSE